MVGLWFVFLCKLGLLVAVVCPESEHGRHRGSREGRHKASFIWQVLGVDGKNTFAQLRHLVDVLLQGFDCQNRLGTGHHPGNITCRKLQNALVPRHVTGEAHLLLQGMAPRILWTGLNMEKIHSLNNLFPLVNVSSSCHKDHFWSRLATEHYLIHRLHSQWRPELIRHRIWQNCPNNVAFLHSKQCVRVLFRSTSCAFLTDIISHLVQGHRFVYDSRHSCDIQYAEDIFRLFSASTNGPSYTWTMNESELRNIMENVSQPYNKGANGHIQSMHPTRHSILKEHQWHGMHTHLIYMGSRLPPSSTKATYLPTQTEQTASISYTTEIPIIQTTPYFSTTTTPVRMSSYSVTAIAETTKQAIHSSSTKVHKEHVPHGGHGNHLGHHPGHRPSWSHHNGKHASESSTSSPRTSSQGPPHKSKRSVHHLYKEDTRNGRSHSKPTETTVHIDEWEPGKLIQMVTGSENNTLTISDFYDLCPVIVHHLLFNDKSTPANNNTVKSPSKAKVYGYSTLAVVIISLCSLMGVFFIKIANGKVRNYVMATMLALAVGNLCGDAVLHLVPEVIGEDGTDLDGDGHFTNEVMLLGNSDIEISSVKMMLMLAGIYMFFLLEMLMSVYHGHDHDVEQVPVPVSQIPKKKALARLPITNTPHAATSSSTSSSHNGNLSSMELAVVPSCSFSTLETVPEEEEEPEPVVMATIRKEKPINLTAAPMTLAWMVVAGDSIHNFADGLEIGATFSKSLGDGFSTSLAVFCHELPHELGDFAVLVSTGMTIKRAILLNFGSALTAFVGLYIGIASGQHDNVRELIFCTGAGMFLYVALGNLVPELMKYFKKHRNWRMFLCQNFGLLLGYIIMIIIAIFEDEILI